MLSAMCFGIDKKEVDDLINIEERHTSVCMNGDTLFSSNNLNSANFLPPDSIPLELITIYGDKVNNRYSLLELGKYNGYPVVIVCGDDGDDVNYVIFVVFSNKIYAKKRLNVTPIYYMSRNEFVKKKFVVYKDFTFKIDTEKNTEEEVTKYTQYYRINDEGDFYEIKKQSK